ncbi:hypothetical protein [Dehalobacter sp.]|uniref:hypothetical protein n=1 Tax=Dehalobacter sp. TaxID=1962289 RepID=UPI002583CCC7|nr:hypothetical protein [Dehalobacter sp.]MDJ0305107.1 hypothetical protein [Dehalobacter sp.]
MKIEKYGSRFWAVYDSLNQLICVTVYKKGALEVLRRLVNRPDQHVYDSYLRYQKALKQARKDKNSLSNSSPNYRPGYKRNKG